MKKYGLWIITLLLLLAVGCGASQEEVSRAVEDAGGIKEGSLTSTGFVLVVENDREDCAILFGADYGLEQWKGGTWRPVKPIRDVAVDSIGYFVLPGESREYEVNWEMHYGSLKAGKYRFVKHIQKAYHDGQDYNDIRGEFYLELPLSL